MLTADGVSKPFKGGMYGPRNSQGHSSAGCLRLWDFVLVISLSGCALHPPYRNEWHIGRNVNIYEPYDNSRDWGPSYLVGPPEHHFGYGSRIDDMRSTTVDGPGAQ